MSRPRGRRAETGSLSALLERGARQHRAGRIDDAAQLYRAVLRAQPRQPDALHLLGVIARQQGQSTRSVELIRQAISVDPGQAIFHANLALVLRERGELTEALLAARQATALAPELAAGHYALGNALLASGEPGAAVAAYRRATELQPDYSGAQDNLLLALLYQPDLEPAELLAEHRAWGERFVAGLAGAVTPQGNRPEPNRRLRVGYVSPDFREHAIAYAVLPLLAGHDRASVEVFCYSNTRWPDHLTAQIRELADGWREIVDRSDEAVAAQIRDDRIDILVDLACHTGGNRLGVFARRPAPVQVTHSVMTSGLPAMDYLLTDGALAPDLAEGSIIERPLRLARCFTSYAPPLDTPPVSGLPALAGEPFTFGSFNNLSKITPRVVALWARLLRAVPGSRLLLKGSQAVDLPTRQRFAALFAAAGVSAERVELLDTSPTIREHLALYGQVDLALDPFPFNGCTSTCEALWMGVPVVTLAGRLFADRAGVSLLRAVGLPELIAANEDEYVETARRWAGDLALLSGLRVGLRERVGGSELCDGRGYAQAVEAAYRAAWERWCRGQGVAGAEASEPSALALVARGQRLHEEGDQAAAEALYRAALERDPAQPDAIHLLGVLALQRGEHRGAVAQIERAIELRSDVAEYFNNLGNAYQVLGRVEQAIGAFESAIRLKPDLARAHNNLGNAYQTLGRLSEAVASYRDALALDPLFADAYSNLGNALFEQMGLPGGMAACQRALTLRPDYAEAYCNLGNGFKTLGRLPEAIDSYRRALELKPEFVVAHDNLLLLLLYSDETTPAALLAEHRHWGELHGRPLTALAEPHRNGRQPGRRLRIGYVSPDFRLHPIAFAVLPLLEHHDRDRFEVFCYSANARRDQLTERIQALATGWREIYGLSDVEVAAQIRADRIDILVDLACHTGGNRLPVFAHKPAPIQISHSVMTTGLDTIDYLISDHHLAPNLGPGAIVEQLIRLPGCYTTYAPPADAPPVGRPPSETSGYVTFGSFNNLTKVTPGVVAVWADLLKAVPGSRLLLKATAASDAATRERYRALFAEHDILDDRLEIIEPLADPLDHLAAYARLDLALDPFPFTGFTTTLEALWMGVPVVTLAGQLFADRGGVTLLQAIGHPELIASDRREYVRLAAELAGDPARLAGLRAGLRADLSQSPICDGPGYTRTLEAAYRQVWRRWCDQQDDRTQAPGIDIERDDDDLEEAVGPHGLAPVAAELAVAVEHHQAGRFDQARAGYERALAIDPEQPDALHLLGVLALQSGEAERAVKLISQAVARRDDLAVYHSNLGNALLALGRLDQAEGSYRRAVELGPELAEPWANLAELLRRRGDPAEALVAAQRAVELRPDFAAGQSALGAALLASGQPGLAVQAWRRALASDPTDAESSNNLGNALRDRGELQAAITSYRRALEIRPDWPVALNNLANALLVAGEHGEAVAGWRRALDLDPELVEARDNLLFGLLYVEGVEPDELLAEYRRWDSPAGEVVAPTRPDPERRLRLGYVSPDFGDHPMARTILPLLANHDRERFEIYCYAGGDRRDAWTERFRGLADGWREVGQLADDELAAQIRADQIDVLVDLACHTRGNRLGVFLQGPAPLQVTHSVMTSGLTALDYLVSDQYLAPDLPAGVVAERLLRLPGCYTAWAPPEQAPPVGPLPALANGYVTFGSFNNLAKLTEGVVALWARLLRAVPGSRLLLKSSVPIDRATAEAYLARFARAGLEPGRVVMLEWAANEADHLALYGRVDVALDPFPFNGFTTTCEALWMGVPVVTLAGRLFADRGGVTLLNAVGLRELVASDRDDYLARVGALIADLPALAGLRAALRGQVQRSALCDGVGYARTFEQAIRGAWRERCLAAGPDLSVLLQEALERHQAGELGEAAALYQRVLDREPEQPDALHLLGVTALQAGQAERAVGLIERALAARPDVAVFHSNLGNAELALGRAARAVERYERAIALAPELSEAFSNRGQAQRLLGRFEAAEASCRRALELRADYSEAHNNLGAALQAQGRLAEAEASFRRALSPVPEYAEALINLGNLQRERGMFGAAVTSLRRAVELRPDLTAAYNNLGNVLFDLHQVGEAEATFRRALEIDPADADALNNLCCLLHHRGELTAAIEAGKRAVELRPDHARAYNNLGNAHKDSGDVVAAERCYRCALELRPDFVAAHDNLLFALLFKAGLEPAELLAEHRRWDERYGRSLAGLAQPHANRPDPSRRLRVGYVSADFCNHPMAYAVLPLLANHDQARFEIFCYATSWKQDATTAQLRGLADQWREVAGLNDDALAELIRRDQIDLLVDLACHTGGNRLQTFARRPAPVQLSHSVMTTGLRAIDYLVTDRHLAPDLADGALAERLLRLPRCYTAYAPPALDLPVGPLPARASGVFTFGSFNNLAKVNDQVVVLWARLLIGVPGSWLLLKGSSPVDQARREGLLERFDRHGVEAGRVEILGKTASMAEHLALYQRVDLALDPFPFNGFSTSCEALWMGVPFVTLAGRLFADRAGVTLLEAVGLPELIAADADGYLARASELASDLDRLATLRAGLRQRLLRSPLCDGPGYARDLEAAYREIWARWCADSTDRSGSSPRLVAEIGRSVSR